MKKPPLKRYSLKQASEFLTEKADVSYSEEDVESLIIDGYLIPGLYLERDDRWLYLAHRDYRELYSKPDIAADQSVEMEASSKPGLSAYHSEEDARLGRFENIEITWLDRYKEDIQISIEELERFLSGAGPNTQASKLKAYLASIEGSRGEVVQSTIEAIIHDLCALVPGFQRFSMPGRVVEFHHFCGLFSPTLACMATISFHDYCKGKRFEKLCGWRRNPKSDPEYWEKIHSDWEKSI